MDNTQQVRGAVQNVGPQPVSPLVAIEATLTAILGAVSTEATLAALETAVAKDATLGAGVAALLAALAPLGTQATLANLLAVLSQPQGASAVGVTGPMVQALVNDLRPSTVDGMLAPLSLNAEGRLRVTTELARTAFFERRPYTPRCQPAFFTSPW